METVATIIAIMAIMIAAVLAHALHRQTKRADAAEDTFIVTKNTIVRLAATFKVPGYDISEHEYANMIGSQYPQYTLGKTVQAITNHVNKLEAALARVEAEIAKPVEVSVTNNHWDMFEGLPNVNGVGGK